MITTTTDSSDSNNVCPYFASSPTRTTPMIDPISAIGAISPSPPPLNKVSGAHQQLQKHSSTLLSTQSIPLSRTGDSHVYHDENPPTQAQIDIVRYTWERISELRLPNDDPNVSATHAFGLAFYDALFEADPSLRPLFSDIFKQARALAGIISFIARSPKITEPNNKSTISPDSTGCPYMAAETPSVSQALTIREINALKRKENAATSFSELITSVATANNKATKEHEEDTERLLCKLRELGARHYFYHVQPHQLDFIGPAMLKAIKKRLQKEFLPEVAEAWTRAHTYAAYHMRAGLEAQTAWEQGIRRSETVKITDSAYTTRANCLIQ